MCSAYWAMGPLEPHLAVPQLLVRGTSQYLLQGMGAELGSDPEVGLYLLTPAGYWLRCSLHPVDMASETSRTLMGAVSPSSSGGPHPHAYLPQAGGPSPAL